MARVLVGAVGWCLCQGSKKRLSHHGGKLLSDFYAHAAT